MRLYVDQQTLLLYSPRRFIKLFSIKIKDQPESPWLTFKITKTQIMNA